MWVMSCCERSAGRTRWPAPHGAVTFERRRSARCSVDLPRASIDADSLPGEVDFLDHTSWKEPFATQTVPNNKKRATVTAHVGDAAQRGVHGVHGEAGNAPPELTTTDLALTTSRSERRFAGLAMPLGRCPAFAPGAGVLDRKRPHVVTGGL
jgi:hypothetical protein